MAFAVIAFLSIFLLIVSAGLLLFYREAMIQRISSVIGGAAKPVEEIKQPSALQQAGTSIGGVVEKFEKVLPKSQAEVSVVQQRLIRAGMRDEGTLKIFYGSKVVVPLILCIILTATGLASQNPFVFYAMALGIGYLIPDFWLGRQIKKRQAKVRRGLPDVLDLLVICVEAGLGLDQATARTARELAFTHPVLADELELVALEQRAGRARSEAWRHMSERTDVDVIKNLVSMLVQSEQFGTSIAKTLRTHSDTLRTQRIQQIEEMAAKTTVKLIFPLVFFIFPCLFLVTLGPAMILMSEEFKQFLSH